MNCPSGSFMTLRFFLANTRRNVSYTTINHYLQESKLGKPHFLSNIQCCFASQYNRRNISGLFTRLHRPEDKVKTNNVVKKVLRNQFVTTVTLEKKKTTTESNYSSDSEDEDLTDDDFNQYAEDYDAPANYKNKEITVNSVRASAVLASSLGTTRSAMDEAFYGRKIMVNGDLLKKKSSKIEDGDYIDLIVGHEENGKKVRRVRILKVLKEKTSKDRQKLMVRVWKAAFTLPQ